MNAQEIIEENNWNELIDHDDWDHQSYCYDFSRVFEFKGKYYLIECWFTSENGGLTWERDIYKNDNLEITEVDVTSREVTYTEYSYRRTAE